MGLLQGGQQVSDKQYEPTYEGQLDKCQDERHALQMQLEEYIEAFKFAHKEFHEALDDLAKMKAERDEARRERNKARRKYCIDMAYDGNTPADIAYVENWDCFKENIDG
jgi:chromosome segregation ATPase